MNKTRWAVCELNTLTMQSAVANADEVKVSKDTEIISGGKRTQQKND